MDQKGKKKVSQRVPKFGQKLAKFDPDTAAEKVEEYYQRLIQFFEENKEVEESSKDKVKCIFNEEFSLFEVPEKTDIGTQNITYKSGKRYLEIYEALDLFSRGNISLSFCDQEDLSHIDVLNRLKQSGILDKYLINSSLKRQGYYLKREDTNLSIYKGSKKSKNEKITDTHLLSLKAPDNTEAFPCISADESVKIEDLARINSVVTIIDGCTSIPLEIKLVDEF
ncbi:unnamed protein product [Moneuplotes crassus]|uniref:tRNA-splicing endonuclease subunit Sen54 N-terminal domain-containing protein n=1 Tax=Euplotes crassus TaxID=5936 RepID=A0AAD1XTS9_EUPCR|nr:unnamed protein product [Moneuplotes crassus]